jgi:hypothetical protein
MNAWTIPSPNGPSRRSWRDDAPAGRLETCRRHLAPRERAVGKVVERSLAESRLVDRVEDEQRFRIGTVASHGHEHRVVRRRDDPTHDRDLAFAQRLERRAAVDHGWRPTS